MRRNALGSKFYNKVESIPSVAIKKTVSVRVFPFKSEFAVEFLDQYDSHICIIDGFESVIEARNHVEGLVDAAVPIT